jgi:hypothetical protein
MLCPSCLALCNCDLASGNRETLGGFWEIQPSPPRSWVKSLFSQKKKPPPYDPSLDDNELITTIWRDRLVASAQEYMESPEMNEIIKATQARRKSRAPSTLPSSSLVTCIMQQLTDMEYFIISPLGGSLKPGEQEQISLRFSYNTVGKHQMLMLVRVLPAIFIWVELKGKNRSLLQNFIVTFYRTLRVLR